MAATGSALAVEPQDRSVIEKVVVIIEQNHTFDSYFAGYPGARGFLSEGLFPTLPDGEGGVAEPPLFNTAALHQAAVTRIEGEGLLSNSSGAARGALYFGRMN